MSPTKIDIKVQFEKAWALIEIAHDIFLSTHEGTDGDDLGSLLAVKKVLEKQNKKITAAVKDGVPKNLLFLAGAREVSDQFEDKKYDLAIIFGCNKLARTGFKAMANINCRIINFDHHPDNTNFGDVNIVDASTSAVAELVYYFLLFKKIEIDKDIATCLLTGIFTDTGGFKHANTSAEALETAAALMKKGARIERIAQQTTSSKAPNTIRAWSKALENTRFDPEKKLIFSVLTEEDLKEIGASENDLDGFVEFLNNIPQAKFALVLRQDGEIVKGSLRSDLGKGVDVSLIARAFGGGGHKLASGFKIRGRLKREDQGWKIE